MEGKLKRTIELLSAILMVCGLVLEKRNGFPWLQSAVSESGILDLVWRIGKILVALCV